MKLHSFVVLRLTINAICSRKDENINLESIEHSWCWLEGAKPRRNKWCLRSWEASVLMSYCRKCWPALPVRSCRWMHQSTFLHTSVSFVILRYTPDDTYVHCAPLQKNEPSWRAPTPSCMIIWKKLISGSEMQNVDLVGRIRSTLIFSFRLRNDLYCVEWGVKLYSLTHWYSAIKAFF